MGHWFQLRGREEKTFRTVFQELIQSSKFRRMDTYVQHGGTSTLAHSIAVAYYSFLLAKRLHLRCCEKSLIRGALLHDFFLYDWHKKEEGHSWHGFRHPKIACKNATEAFALSAKEQDIICHHMFPLTPAPPKHLEALLVCLVDKVCSLRETFSRKPYRNLPFVGAY